VRKKNKTSASEMMNTAIHESGHVVANLHFGLRFDEVVLTDDCSGGEVNLWDGQRPKNVSEAKPYTIALFSGYAAAHVILGDDLIVEEGDWEHCRLRVLPLFRSEARFDAFTDKMLKAAVKFARNQSAKIQAVANVLIKRKRLSESDAKKIVDRKL
jgi:hypothetical protein